MSRAGCSGSRRATEVPKHGPNRLDNYTQIHDTCMQRFLRDGFIIAEALRFENLGNGYIAIVGTIDCMGGVVLEVDKLLAIQEGEGADALVQTVIYTYHAHVAGQGNILRYDSPHPDHNQFHHVHRYKFDGDGADHVTELTWEDVPTLAEVVEELRTWVYQRWERLPGLQPPPT